MRAGHPLAMSASPFRAQPSLTPRCHNGCRFRTANLTRCRFCGRINFCQELSFITQLTFTASDSFMFMMTVDLLLNLYTSPFGQQWQRWIFYFGWTLTVSFVLATLLVASGDWGVSTYVPTKDNSDDEGGSILEDFCWCVRVVCRCLPQCTNPED